MAPFCLVSVRPPPQPSPEGGNDRHVLAAAIRSASDGIGWIYPVSNRGKVGAIGVVEVAAHWIPAVAGMTLWKTN